MGWFLENTGGIFNEVSFFGLLLFIMFGLMFGLVAVSYTRIDIIERVSVIDVLFLNIFITSGLASYWMTPMVTIAVMQLTLIVWVVQRFYRSR